MGKTSIEWTDYSINPLRARLNGCVGHYCEKVSPGCKNCYSSRTQCRFGMPAFQEQRGNPEVEHFLDASKLEEVLRRRKPTKFFWCDMTDMFGDWVPFEWIAACFGVMAATPQHIHQVITKRPRRMLEFFRWIDRQSAPAFPLDTCHTTAATLLNRLDIRNFQIWPLPNVWLGVSTEDQQRADERIPLLLECPAAIRFVSYEPALGSIDFREEWMRGRFVECPGETQDEDTDPCRGCPGYAHEGGDYCGAIRGPKLDWIIVGGESGNGARPMEETWVRSTRDQCAAAGVKFFYKQKLEGKKKVGLPLLDGRQWTELP